MPSGKIYDRAIPGRRGMFTSDQMRRGRVTVARERRNTAARLRGTTMRENQGHLRKFYGVEVSPALISAVTDAVLEEVEAWQSRPLKPLYPIVYTG